MFFPSNSYMEFQAFLIFHIPDMRIKLCQVVYVLLVDNVPIHRTS